MSRSPFPVDASFNAQERCVFYSLVPGEVRDRIFEFTLMDFEDQEYKYEENGYCFRPQYTAARRSDTTLIRTCKRIYNETWFRPWTSSQHTVWLADPSRCPPNQPGVIDMSGLDERIASIHGYHGYVELQHIRFFAQLCALEPGEHLQRYLQIPHFYPRSVTITIRHTDFWWWEHDNPLMIRADWVRECTFPTSVRALRLEMETLDRKKDQLESLAEQMKRSWTFKRQDGVMLVSDPDAPDEITTWTGSSSLNQIRWVRDEIPAYPGKLSYHVRTVLWRADPSQSTHRELTALPKPRRIDAKTTKNQLNPYWPYLNVQDCALAGITDDTPVDRALELWQQWHADRILEHVERQRRADESALAASEAEFAALEAALLNNIQNLPEESW